VCCTLGRIAIRRKKLLCAHFMLKSDRSFLWVDLDADCELVGRPTLVWLRERSWRSRCFDHFPPLVMIGIHGWTLLRGKPEPSRAPRLPTASASSNTWGGPARPLCEPRTSTGFQGWSKIGFVLAGSAHARVLAELHPVQGA